MAEKKVEEYSEMEFIEKPLRKPDKRIVGRLERWEDSDFQQFVPAQTGCGTKRTVMKSSGRTKLVKNEGEKDTSFSLHSNHSTEEDQFAEKMLDETLDVLKPYIKKEVKIPNARFLHDEEAFKVWASREKKSICIHAELDACLDSSLVAKEWNRISYEVTKILFSSVASGKKK